MSAYDNYMEAAHEADANGDTAKAQQFLDLANQARTAQDAPQAPAPGEPVPVQVPDANKQDMINLATGMKPGVGGHWYTTGPLEFGKGVPQGALSLPDIPHDLSSLANQSLSLFTTSGQAPGIPLIPKLGAADAYKRAVPVTPGYEGWRDAGDTTGAFIAQEALTGGIGGIGGLATKGVLKTAADVGKDALIKGTLGGVGAGVGENVGEGVGGSLFGPKGALIGRTVGSLAGGLTPAVLERGSGLNALRNWTDADSAARAAAMERLGLKPTIPAIGNDAARREVTRLPFTGGPSADFSTQISGLNQKAADARAAVSGSTAPLTDTSVGATGTQAQVAATAASAAAKAGKDAVLDPVWTQMRTNKNLDASGTLKALDDNIATAVGDDRRMLQQAKADLLDAARRSGWKPGKAGKPAPPLTVDPDMMREWGSGVKGMLSPTTSKGLLDKHLTPVTDAIAADQAAHYVKTGGTAADFQAANDAAKPFYDDRRVAKDVLGTDPTNKQSSSYSKVASDTALQNTNRLAALGRQAPQETAKLKGMLLQNGLLDEKGNISPKTADWWASLPEGTKINLSNGNAAIRQEFDDIALASKGMTAPKGGSSFQKPSLQSMGLGGLLSGAAYLIPGVGKIMPAVNLARTVVAPTVRNLVNSGPAALKAMRSGEARSLPSVLSSSVVPLAKSPVNPPPKRAR